MLGALALSFALVSGANAQGNLHLAAAAAVGFVAASRVPKTWAPILGAGAATACAAFVSGMSLTYGLGYGAAFGLLIWCAVRLSRYSLQNLK